MARQGYSDEVKAAVMAALLAGQSSSAIAATYNIPQTTIRAWKSRQHNGEGVATVTTEKKTRIGDMLIDLLETQIETLKDLSIAARYELCLKLQHAEGMAVFSFAALMLHRRPTACDDPTAMNRSASPDTTRRRERRPARLHRAKSWSIPRFDWELEGMRGGWLAPF